MKRLRIVFLVALMLMLYPMNVDSHSRVKPFQFKPRANGVTIQINYGNGTTATHEDVAGSHVLEATESVALVQADWTGDLAFVFSIDGISSKDGSGLWWQYWVNGEFASVAANIYEVQDDDTIIWKFIDSQVEQPTSTQTNEPGLFGSLAIGSIGLGVLGIGFLIILYLLTKRN